MGAGPRADATPASSAPSLDVILKPRSWQGVSYRPLTAGGAARDLFAYAALWVPPVSPGELGWGAWVTEDERAEPGERDGRGEARVPAERLLGALLLERHGSVGTLYGPVVVNHPDPYEVASQLMAATLPHATAVGIGTLFTRPQGLDRVWVRFGFIPVPEADLPKVLKGRPGTGLFAWRGGSALWSARKTGSSEPVELP